MPTDLPRPRFARMYLKASPRADRRGAGEHRRRLLEDLAGRVVEIGAGNGLNFAHYPRSVTEVVAIEPEPTLRAAAQDAAARAPVPVDVRGGTADRVPLDDGEMDAAVASLVLCTVPDQGGALAELHRVLRPGGELRFYEHVIPASQPRRVLFQLADHSGLWPAIGGGCHPARDTAAAIEAAGFAIERCERFDFRAGGFEPSVP
ncbi:MAG TPA: class I SAM-dependent methyltransferase, partial [Solirubrobacteraceae bacterium]